MNEKARQTLEYDKILSRLESFASSPMGKARCAALLPSADYDEIVRAQGETADALRRIYQTGRLSFHGLSDIRPHLKRLEIESTLSAKELLEIARLLSVTAQVKAYGSGGEEDAASDSIQGYFDGLDPLDFLHRRITECILSADEISDDASAALKDIRREIKQTNLSVHNKLTSIINSQSSRTVLQDALITMRNGRYCVPVKAEYKNTFPVMIHDQSASGSTLFIEPMSVVQLNNKLKELDIEEQAEIERVLMRLCAEAAQCTRELMENQNLLTTLDFLFAKASFAREYNGSEPIFNTEGIIDIKEGRHPLLDPRTVVPIHIYVGDAFHMLLITGPNTGGKTVSLKTVGLFQLMGQAGLHIPAFEGSKLSVFSDVFADIGDEQSIEMNLSTFSSHMTNIIHILNEAKPDSLILLDELCSGTDPTEGSALAVAILQKLHEAKIRTIATTHYAELKMYAMETPGVENGCCEFDLATLSPTYHLLIGIPGKSNAFAISSRLGLSDAVIESARSKMDAFAIDYETMLAELEKNKNEMEAEQEELAKMRRETERLRAQLHAQKDDEKEKREALLHEAREEAHRILSDAKETADETLRKYNAWIRHPEQDNRKKMEARRSALRGKMRDLEQNLSEQKKTEHVSESGPESFHVGDAVYVHSLSLKGTVASAANKSGDLVIQMGFLSSTVHYTDLSHLDETKEGPKDRPKDHYSINKAAGISPEINLLGCTVDEAASRLEKYLDDAMIAGLESVRIVHGKGTGALRKGIHEYLRRLKFVKSYKLAEFGEGDAGVTIVTFR